MKTREEHQDWMFEANRIRNSIPTFPLIKYSKEEIKERRLAREEHRREQRRLKTEERLYKIRSKKDSLLRIKESIRAGLYSLRKGKTKGKRGSAIKNLGCSVIELRAHIESLWKEGMTWENHGKFGWHIDHKISLSSVDLASSEQVKRVCHYTNLQPLWWRENLSKGNR